MHKICFSLLQARCSACTVEAQRPRLRRGMDYVPPVGATGTVVSPGMQSRQAWAGQPRHLPGSYPALSGSVCVGMVILAAPLCGTSSKSLGHGALGARIDTIVPTAPCSGRPAV
eukprot:364372-Chlamydomonas_euryale.AAC.9